MFGQRHFTKATPRERQFGMYESPRRRRSSSQGAVEVPLSQLHVVAAQRQLPMLLEALPETDASEAIFVLWLLEEKIVLLCVVVLTILLSLQSPAICEF